MTTEDRELLLKDLCTRLPYGLLCYCEWAKEVPNGTDGCVQELSTYLIDEFEIMEDSDYECQISGIKPYLRPMSSMTEEERKELWGLLKTLGITAEVKRLDWLVAHHFDIRNLIEKGLAIEAPEGMYNV